MQINITLYNFTQKVKRIAPFAVRIQKELIMKINYRNTEISFDGGEISSNGGLLLYKVFADRIGLKAILESHIQIDDNKVHRLHQPKECLEQQLYSIIAGYEDNNDATYLRKDKLFQSILEKDVLASQSTLCRYEASYSEENEAELMNVNVALIKRAHQIKASLELVFDLDSTDDEVHGKQEGAKYNGFYGHNVYHPMFCFDGLTKDLLKAQLREGNVYTSNGVIDFIKPLLIEFKTLKLKSRGDSGFAIPELFELYEEKDVLYYIKLKVNAVLSKLGKKYLDENQIKVADDKPFYFEIIYGAGSWRKSRRVLCKAEYRHLELLSQLTVSYVVTNDLTISPEDGFNFYNGRANVENCIKEVKLDLSAGKLSLSSFISNSCRLQVFSLAYNFNNLLRRLALPGSLNKKRLITLRTQLIKVGCRIVYHSRKTIFRLSSSFTMQRDYIRSFENIMRLQYSYE